MESRTGAKGSAGNKVSVFCLERKGKIVASGESKETKGRRDTFLSVNNNGGDARKISNWTEEETFFSLIAEQDDFSKRYGSKGPKNMIAVNISMALVILSKTKRFTNL